MAASEPRTASDADPADRASTQSQTSPSVEPSGGHSSSRARPVASPLEWVVAGASTLLILGVVAFMLYDALASSTPWPDLVVEPIATVSMVQGYLVEFRVRKEGGRTVAGLKVEGVLKQGAERIETSDITIDYVPGRSSRRGALNFVQDPRRYQLELNAKGFDEP